MKLLKNKKFVVSLTALMYMGLMFTGDVFAGKRGGSGKGGNSDTCVKNYHGCVIEIYSDRYCGNDCNAMKNNCKSGSFRTLATLLYNQNCKGGIAGQTGHDRRR